MQSNRIHTPDRRIERRTEEPTASDLRAIEAEWPLIAAEVELVNAEVAALSAPSAMSELARRRVRRAEGRVVEEARTWAACQQRPRHTRRQAPEVAA
ncbi:hypothetical protein CLV92_102187 [Kineococcus xinjiangensis]|uniref:Uncharacterized protein n=1 Tax=Kineococcus xinjiangensis TaxID=512762 RepID=A0A2S6IVF0_9ACTN|nr:DUF6284 family protein [Kineococcus xinjiangensis]PPK98034.1 hypothetical protein CLV92_102187 [Kineococcus xinjiangensis]